MQAPLYNQRNQHRSQTQLQSSTQQTAKGEEAQEALHSLFRKYRQVSGYLASEEEEKKLWHNNSVDFNFEQDSSAESVGSLRAMSFGFGDPSLRQLSMGMRQLSFERKTTIAAPEAQEINLLGLQEKDNVNSKTESLPSSSLKPIVHDVYNSDDDSDGEHPITPSSPLTSTKVVEPRSATSMLFTQAGYLPMKPPKINLAAATNATLKLEPYISPKG